MLEIYLNKRRINLLVMNIKEQLQTRLQLKEGAEVEYKSAKGGFPQSFWSSFLHLPIPMVVIWCWGVKEKNGGLCARWFDREANYRLSQKVLG